MLKWLRFSGMSVILTINPLHWSWIPKAYKPYDEWAGPNEWTGQVSWIFLTVRVWIDDGSW